MMDDAQMGFSGLAFCMSCCMSEIELMYECTRLACLTQPVETSVFFVCNTRDL